LAGQKGELGKEGMSFRYTKRSEKEGFLEEKRAPIEFAPERLQPVAGGCTENRKSTRQSSCEVGELWGPRVRIQRGINGGVWTGRGGKKGRKKWPFASMN